MSLTKSISGLSPNTRYAVKVRSFSNFNIASAWSEAFVFTMPGVSSTPNVPGNLITDFQSPNVSISWDPVTDNADDTALDLAYYLVTITANSISKTYQTANTFFVYTFAQNKVDFTTPQPSLTFSIQAVDTFNNLSGTATTTVVNAVPSTPTSGPSLTAGYNVIDLLLTTTALDLLSYGVQHSTDNATWSTLSAVTNDFYSHVALTSNTAHYYRFNVKDVFNQTSAGYSPSTNITTLTIVGAPDTDVPLAPTITVSAPGVDLNDVPLIDLAWDAVEIPDLDHYDVRISVHNINTWTQYNLSHTTLSFTFNNLTGDTDYDVQVRTVDSSNNDSVWSSATVNSGHGTGTLPLPPSLDTTPGVEAIYISWQANTQATFDHYELWASQTSGFTPHDAGTFEIYSGTSSAFVYDVGAGQTWYFRLAVVDIYGNGIDTFTPGFAGHSYATSGQTIINTDNFVVTADGTVSARQITVTGGKIGDVTITDSAETQVSHPFTLPSPPGTIFTVPVFNTIGFPSAATITVGTTAVAYTGVTSTSFTGCTSSSSGNVIYAGATVYYQGLLSGGLIRGTTFQIGTGGIDFTGSGNIAWQPAASGKIIVSNSGSVQSANFVAMTSGWQLGPAGLEINDGNIIISASHFVKSSNFSTGVSGWQLGSTGLEINGGSITAPIFRSSFGAKHLEIKAATDDAISFFGGSPLETIPATISMDSFDVTSGGIKDTLLIQGNQYNGLQVPHIKLRSRTDSPWLVTGINIQADTIGFSVGFTNTITFTGSGDIAANGGITANGAIAANGGITANGAITATGAIKTFGGFKTYSDHNAFWLDWTGSAIFFMIDGTAQGVIYDDGGGGTAVRFGANAPKSFIIDHPIEKDKYLVHACLEGPESAVYYRGEGRCANGQAEIILPSYFEAATRQEGRTVQLTPIFDRSRENAQLASSVVRGGQFKVYSSQSETKFYWEVKAVRSDVEQLDPTPQKNTIQVYGGDGPYKWFTSTSEGK